MQKFKKFVKYFTIVSLTVALFHIATWSVFTKYVYPKEYIIGDLGRMSYQLDTFYPRLIDVTLNSEKKTYKDVEHKKFETVTFGDSFSNGGGSGLNTFYQYYISHFNKTDVLNIQNSIGAAGYTDMIVALLNGGYFKKWETKYIILESVERESVKRLSSRLDFKFKYDFKENDLDNMDCFCYKKALDKVNQVSLPVQNFSLFDFDRYSINVFNNLNFNAFLYNFAYSFDDKAFSSSVYKVKLDRDMFSVDAKNSLLFYKDDIKGLYKSNENSLKSLNENLNKLADILKLQGIKLYFMPAVDKYNLYGDYIQNNKYPKSVFFELLRKLPKKYFLIDTKEILSDELKKGVKDIYYSDDTHWSYKASKAIFEKVKFD